MDPCLLLLDAAVTRDDTAQPTSALIHAQRQQLMMYNLYTGFQLCAYNFNGVFKGAYRAT